jgi:hypothetical protein
MQFEDYCCMMASFDLLLPRVWRDENVRIRHKLAIVEYPRLADTGRKARILDDVWPELWAIIPPLVDVARKLPKIKDLAAGERAAAAIELKTMVAQFEEALEQLLNLPHVLEVLEPAVLSSSYPSKHAHCCPPPPFIPHTLQFPPSGVFRMVTLATKGYIKTIIRPQIQIAGGFETELVSTDATYSIEICRTFAGIEDVLGDSPDACLPLFSPLLLAISTCPVEYRWWFMHKMTHFEQMGLATFRNPIMKYVAGLWNVQDIKTELKGVPALLSPEDDAEDVIES